MPKISFATGLTLHLGTPSNNEYIRRTIEVSDFDTEIPFEDQIQKVHATVCLLGQWADEQLAKWVEEELGRRTGNYHA